MEVAVEVMEAAEGKEAGREVSWMLEAEREEVEKVLASVDEVMEAQGAVTVAEVA